MSKPETIKLNNITLSFDEDNIKIEHRENSIFTSLNSKFLLGYVDGTIKTELFDTDDSLEGLDQEYINNYRRFLGSRYIHLGDLFQAGVTNTNYDLTLEFDIQDIFSQPCLICNHDYLSQLLLYKKSHQIDKIFKDKKNYKKGDEVLVRSLDIKKALLVLYSSKEAAEALIKYPFFIATQKIDFTKEKKLLEGLLQGK